MNQKSEILFKIAFGPLCIIFLMFISSCETIYGSAVIESDPITHELFDDLLISYVSDDGVVDYEGFSTERAKLDSYTALISANPPTFNWTPDETKAYWINAYNAFTVQLVLDNLPLESILDVNKAFRNKFIPLGDIKISLNTIEHERLREDTKDSRIHFAINCASQSCPILYNRAFTAESLENQLDAQSAVFVNDTKLNEYTDVDKLKLSSIFKWYRTDFNPDGGIIGFINEYKTGEQIAPDAMISYLEYDWSLNDQ